MDASGAIARLAAARPPGPAALAFDADGTLWAGDVGEDVFLHACERGLLREAAAPALRAVAAGHAAALAGLAGPSAAPGPTPSELALGLFQGYRRGEVNEHLMCEVMTWAYAGHSPEELLALSREAVLARDLPARVHSATSAVLDWARTAGVRVFVVSASPRLVVTAALAAAGLPVDAVAGAEAALDGGLLAPRMAAPLPYAQAKVGAGAALLERAEWLASFGDNVFDAEMLARARLGFAVHPKPALRARLAELPNTVILE